MPDSIVSAAALAPKEAISFLRQKANVQSATFGELEAEAHARAFTVAGAASDALLNDFRRGIDEALRGKTTLKELVKGFPDLTKRYGWEYNGTPGWRAMIIYQTNISTAYAAGQYRQLTTPEALEMFPYWRYRHHACEHPRAQHLAWDGMILPANDPWFATHFPPNGWRCHCTVEPVSRRNLKKFGWSVSEAPPIETRPWKNPATGKIEQVPVGIDPGFNSNPGAVWIQAEKVRAETALTPVTEVSGKPVVDLPPVERQTLQAEQIEDLLEHPVGVVEAGTLSPDIQKIIRSESDSLRLSEDNLKKNQTHHAEVEKSEYQLIPQLVADTQMVLSAGSERHVMLFSTYGKQIYRMLIKSTANGKENYLLSFHAINGAEVKRYMRTRECLLGSLEIPNVEGNAE